MAVTAKNKPWRLTIRQREGRAMNAVAELLREKLSVPNIYLRPQSAGLGVDVLAVDRAGAGDLHAVEINFPEDFKWASEQLPKDSAAWNQVYAEFMPQFRKHLAGLHRKLMSLPAHYRYLAIPIPKVSFELLAGELASGLYSPDGIGRLGIMAIAERGDKPPLAEILIEPERFRVDPARLLKVEKTLLEKVRPDIEVRI